MRTLQLSVNAISQTRRGLGTRLPRGCAKCAMRKMVATTTETFSNQCAPNPLRARNLIMNSVAVEETDILQILRDYLEESGRAGCLVALETGSSGVGPPQNLPAEIRFLRELILAGRWGDLTSFMEPLAQLHGEDHEFRNCQYAIAKQQYLETLVSRGGVRTRQGGLEEEEEEEEVRENRKLQKLKTHLVRLQHLCPSKEDYSKMLYLLTLPSLAAHDEYGCWNVDRSRLECFYAVGSWVGKVLYPESGLSLGVGGRSAEQLASSRLVQLLSKGLLYEECEAACSQRGETVEKSSEILDLCSWMRHQPDSAFQLTPSKLSLVLVPHVGSTQGGEAFLTMAESDSPNRVSPLSTSESVPWKTSLPTTHIPQQEGEKRGLLSRSVPEMPISELGREEGPKETSELTTHRPKTGGEEIPLWQKRSLWRREKWPGSSTAAPGKEEEVRGVAVVSQEQHLQEEVDLEGIDGGESSGIGAIGSDPEAHQLPFSLPAKVIMEPKAPPSTSEDTSPGKMSKSSAVSKPKDKPKVASTEGLHGPGPTNVPLSDAQSLPPPPPRTHSYRPPQVAFTGHTHQVSERFDDNFTQPEPAPPLSQVTPGPTYLTTPLNPSLRGCPDSSTPKPTSSHPPMPHPPLPSSPVPYVSGTHGLSDTPYREGEKPGQIGLCN